MAEDWIIDVLADLRQYAIRNYHMRLAEQLDDAILVAATELRAADSALESGLQPPKRRSEAPIPLFGALSGPADEKIFGPA
ncbi:hypothetical protein P2H44_01155 [Albimonas sp. CAU 1670]|uniref:hypothetical protein n=1 Tax=Albimonas sp. CAU 1670 TaxID=3032599 RepID=UPI0023DB9ECA|nr:hypothetical protein [Albimonas sp. CAU 1670]MDF2231153.1 hypothetical protein [Albimonas sp. CAU 1670]